MMNWCLLDHEVSTPTGNPESTTASGVATPSYSFWIHHCFKLIPCTMMRSINFLQCFALLSKLSRALFIYVFHEDIVHLGKYLSSYMFIAKYLKFYP